ncbi:MAG: DUF695 domain-containing protein, partial [Myxococcota bacterium]
MDHAISEFWSFWATSAPQLRAAIEAGTLLDWVELIQARVEAIHEGLDWEFGPGATAEHYFCVSAKGDPDVRVVAERWLAAAPPADATFEFYPARPGSGPTEAILDLGPHRFALADFRYAVSVDGPRERIAARVYHPGFGAAPENTAVMATFLGLDGILGEDEVERWLGGVETVNELPADAVDEVGLVEAVSRLRATATGEQFTVMRGQLPDGRPVFVTANLALKRIDHLRMDTHYQVTLPLRSPDAAGLIGPDEAEALNQHEDALLKALGTDAVYLGRETGAGARVVHLHGPAGLEPRLEG